MDGILHPGAHPAAPATLAEGTLLQTVPLDRATALRPLYWRELRHGRQQDEEPRVDGPGGLVLPEGTAVSFDTYFAAFFEYHWRLYTALRTLTLRLRLDGGARLRLWRRVPHGADTLLHEQPVHGPADIDVPGPGSHFRQGGLVWFDLAAIDGPVRLDSAAWVTVDSPVAPVGLGVAICTFNRDGPLAAVLDAVAGHAPLDGAVARVAVVNQGSADLWRKPGIAAAAARLGPRLRPVDQANFGGAGGFGRGLLEGLGDPAVTHVCFLDDDVALEPDCLLRMARFFALARPGVAVGGHMLDAVQPLRLYEAGATVTGKWTLQPRFNGLDLRDPGTLTVLLDTAAIHYNGWWMFGFPKRLVEQVGMPLPCFIRGDDVEWGMRLHAAGIPTVPLPGVAIWHEPFYLKLGGWQLYYETRNDLLAAALHQHFSRAGLAARMARRLLTYLLTYRYYGAALVIRGIEDFTAGPGFLRGDPRPRHAGLSAIRDAFPQAWAPRERVLPAAPVGRSPRWRPGFVLAMARALNRNWFRPTRPDAPLAAMDVRDHVWFRVMASDGLAVDTHWDAERPVYRRDRAAFRRLSVAGARAIWRLCRNAPALQRDVRDAAAQASAVAAWRDYLGLDGSRAP